MNQFIEKSVTNTFLTNIIRFFFFLNLLTLQFFNLFIIFNNYIHISIKTISYIDMVKYILTCEVYVFHWIQYTLFYF